MPERLAVLAAIAVFSGWHWRELERPQVAVAELALLAVLATIPGLLAAIGRRRWAFASIPVVIWCAVWATFGYQPWEFDHRIYPLRVVVGLQDGARSWFDAVTPFDGGRFALTGSLVELAFFALMAVLAWLLLDGRFALSSVAAGFALFAIPSTALTSPDSGLRAAVFLGLALATIAVCQRQRPVRGIEFGQFAVLAAATIAVGLVVATAPGVAKGALFDWRHWNPLGGEQSRVSVAYVWDQHYGDLKWPKKRTIVFEVASPSPHYWKAGILNDFEVDHWQAGPSIQQDYTDTSAIGVPDTSLPAKAAVPDHRSDIVLASFKIEGLADDHLLSTGQPIRYDLDHSTKATLYTDGTAVVENDPDRGATYTLRGYAPDPTPSQLADAGTSFPFEVASGNLLGGNSIPIWGTPGAGDPATIGEALGSPPLQTAVTQVWQLSGADKTNTEYAAVVAVEAYLRARPFTYDQTPSYRPDTPVLADFLVRSHRGYCQMFSGSMALVLRAYGIPARVAVGFTEGHQTSPGHYAIADRDAHSWVEAYFPKYGWLPFDPTPTRNLTAQASTSSTGFAKVARVGDAWLTSIPRDVALSQQIGPAGGPSGPHGLNQDTAGHHGLASGSSGGAVAAPRHHRSLLLWILSAALLLVGVVAALKLAVVRSRYLRRGPRGQSAAAYHELSTYVGDQGIAVPANATFEELAAIVRATWGVDASALATAGSAARYAPPPDAAVAGHEVRPELRRVKRRIRGYLSLRERAEGALRLRSVLAQTTHLE
jgi:hypothetical protein